MFFMHSSLIYLSFVYGAILCMVQSQTWLKGLSTHTQWKVSIKAHFFPYLFPLNSINILKFIDHVCGDLFLQSLLHSINLYIFIFGPNATFSSSMLLYNMCKSLTFVLIFQKIFTNLYFCISTLCSEIDGQFLQGSMHWFWMGWFWICRSLWRQFYLKILSLLIHEHDISSYLFWFL